MAARYRRDAWSSGSPRRDQRLRNHRRPDRQSGVPQCGSAPVADCNTALAEGKDRGFQDLLARPFWGKGPETVAWLVGSYAESEEANKIMDIVILRHAEAEPRGNGVAEADRKLTTQGKKDLKKVLRRARARGVSPALILTSPWTRALDTARMAQKALKSDELLETKKLLPDIAPQEVWKEIRVHR